MSDHTDRLAKVAPRITYVILCWEGIDDGAPSLRRDRPSTILGPFTEYEASAVALTLTCECLVTNITTTPPAWATSTVQAHW